MAVSDCDQDVLVTHSLGSCLGLTLFDPLKGIGGMIHCQLPLIGKARKKIDLNPCKYVDSGVSALFYAMFAAGAKKQQLVAKIFGCAESLGATISSQIGHRNYTIVRKILWKNDIFIAGEEVGGDIPRTIHLHIDTGNIVIGAGDEERIV